MKDSPRTTRLISHLAGLTRHAAVIGAVLLAFILGLVLASSGSGTKPRTAAQSQDSSTPAEVWTCPMHSQIRKPGPGACPICGMELTRVEASPADSSSGSAGQADQTTRITLTERARILARIRTAPVKPMATTTRQLRLLGRIAYDETRIKTVTAWTGGRIDRLRVATTGQTITAQQTIAKLYSPEIYAAQSDLIQAVKQVARLAESDPSVRRGAEAARDAAEQRLRLLGVPGREIAAMGTAESPRRHIWIRTPFAGTITERLVDEGNYVKAGSPLYRVADLSRVWVQLDAYETDLPLLDLGDRVSLNVIGIPDREFEGAVTFIDPVVDPGTRIVALRVEVDNPDGHLRPGMFAEAVLHSERHSAPGLMVPRTAPLFTGVRSLVYVEIPDSERPTYEAREVTLGPRAGDFYPVLSGLREGERVVVRGAFVIDADLQIRGGQSMMTRDDPHDPEPAPSNPHAGHPHR